MINTFNPPHPPSRGFVGLLGGGELSAALLCKQNLPTQVDVAAHAVILRKKTRILPGLYGSMGRVIEGFYLGARLISGPTDISSFDVMAFKILT
jgi:hypothetical protein